MFYILAVALEASAAGFGLCVLPGLLVCDEEDADLYLFMPAQDDEMVVVKL